MPDPPAVPDIRIPAGLLPGDGRFGSGPSKVRPEAAAALAAASGTLLGTSHRARPVRDLVARIRADLAVLWDLPDGYRVVLGNGGATAFWDVAAFCLVSGRSEHLVFGQFSAGFADAARGAPHLAEPVVVASEPGTRPEPDAHPGVDLYALTQCETSTGVAAPVARPVGADDGAIVAVDATSAAGGICFDPAEVDAYYFSPQKCFGSEGGLWVAVLSPAALARVAALGGRWRPASLDLAAAAAQAEAGQTLNTPAISTLFLLADQLAWMLEGGGMAFAAGRSAESARILYGWVEASGYAQPFVADPGARSPVVATVDLDVTVPAAVVSAVLRANGIVDTEGYRKLRRNQLRVGMWPAVEAADVEALTACVDHVVGRL
jgi:phosphoserine aminotransferase